MAMIDVTSVSSRAEVTVTIGVTGTPSLKADYSPRTFQPNRITTTFRYESQRGDDGWTSHVWRPVDVKVSGPRILKPAPDGSQRLGLDVLSYCPINLDEVPEWLRKLNTELRPSGDIALAGA